MNIREFKKDVEYVVGGLVDDCSLFTALKPNKSSDKVDEIIEEAVALYNDLKDKANAKIYPKGGKAWFDGLRKEMLEKTDALYEKLSAIVAATDEK